MASSTLSLPPVPSTLDEMLAIKAIPALNSDQLTELTGYLFRYAGTSLRVRVAEITYRNHLHPQAHGLFLASTMPLAQKWTQRKAERFFVYPSAWQAECLYNGAVNALISMFQRPVTLHSIHDSFRRYLYRSMLKGACGECFRRGENNGIHAVGTVDQLSSRNPMLRTAEQELITRDLLEQIAHYPLLQRFLSKTLECVVALGYDGAVREHKTPEHHPRMRDARRVLDKEAIAKVRGVKPAVVLKQLHLARAVIRKAFNGDGRLFQTR